MSESVEERSKEEEDTGTLHQSSHHLQQGPAPHPYVNST
jgi:hypothetical protein